MDKNLFVRYVHYINSIRSDMGLTHTVMDTVTDMATDMVTEMATDTYRAL